MNNIRTQSVSFTGYDVTRLKGLYMQGMRTRGERNIFRELRGVLKKEGLDVFLNNTNARLSDRFETDGNLIDKALSIWGQDRKAFVLNSKGKQVLWNTTEPLMKQEDLGKLSDFEIHAAKYIPRGGDYYLGLNKKNERWLLVNSKMIYDQNAFERFADAPTDEILTQIFDVKPKNICKLDILGEDLDEVVRPIGYPYILVNDFDKSKELLAEIHKAYPKDYFTQWDLLAYIEKKSKNIFPFETTETICNILKNFGFKPIRIGGRFNETINFLNAIAFRNSKGKITYISNSTRKAEPPVEFLEKLFDRELRKSVPEISDTYYICGGKRTPEEIFQAKNSIYNNGLSNRNVIMDILANRHGGIHCMSAEIPEF